jgi:osmoprotectant transport system permease protein
MTLLLLGYPIVVASKNFTEQHILAELMAQLLEAKTNLTILRKLNLGTTEIVHEALLKGEVDLYPEYSGTAYLTVLKRPWEEKKRNVFKEVKEAYREKFNLIWLKPFGFSNSQSLAVPKKFAQDYNITCITDLASLSSHLCLAAPPEFLKRKDGLLNLSRVYGLKFKNVLQIDISLLYRVLDHKDVDIIVAFTTDGKIKKYNLILLQDDKNFYPPY